jgi:hypothetical protein
LTLDDTSAGAPPAAAPARKDDPVKKLLCILALAALAAVMLGGCSDENNTVTGPTSNYSQVDRMAIPGLNTALIPSAQKEAFNRASPTGDVANYRSTVVTSITNLRADALSRGLGPETGSLTPDQLADVIIPDVVTIDFSQSVVFPNGRDLDDDVIDGVLSLVLNRSVSDGVGADNTNLSTFPYLGVPNALPGPRF